MKEKAFIFTVVFLLCTLTFYMFKLGFEIEISVGWQIVCILFITLFSHKTMRLLTKD